MRKPTFIAAALAALCSSIPLTSAFAQEEGEDEGYVSETVVYAQRRLVMAPSLVRPELSFFVADYGGDTIVGLGVGVDWTPLDKLQVGAVASPRISPDTFAGDPMLYVRYQLLEGAVQLALHGGYTFTDPGPGSVHLGVPLRFVLNPAARLDFTPLVDFNLPNKDNDPDDKLSVDLNLLLSLGISLTRALYVDFTSGLVIPELEFDFASIPLGLEIGYSIKGGEETAFVDVFLRARFDQFLRPSAPEGSDTLNLDIWQIALGARVHFGLE